MELGEKLYLARQEAGLSQRQLCGEQITRNMLSQIEHGTARPSMDTLRYLAARLGKPVSYFLEEEAVVSANLQRMLRAEEAAENRDWDQVRQLLADYRQPDRVFDSRFRYLRARAAVGVMEQAVNQEKYPYARSLAREAEGCCEAFPWLRRELVLLLGRLPGENLTALAEKLPFVDEDLLLRAQAALQRKDAGRSAAYLAAAEDQSTPRWALLMGQTLLLRGEYAAAKQHLLAAYSCCPAVCNPLLEICCRELGDFRSAYEYACLQRKET